MLFLATFWSSALHRHLKYARTRTNTHPHDITEASAAGRPLHTSKPGLTQATRTNLVRGNSLGIGKNVVFVAKPYFQVDTGPVCVWSREGTAFRPIESLPPKQVGVLGSGRLGYDKAERREDPRGNDMASGRQGTSHRNAIGITTTPDREMKGESETRIRAVAPLFSNKLTGGIAFWAVWNSFCGLLAMPTWH